MKTRVVRRHAQALLIAFAAVAVPVVAVALNTNDSGSVRQVRAIPTLDVTDAAGSVRLQTAVEEDIVPASLAIVGRQGGFVVLTGKGVDPALPNCLVVLDLMALVQAASIGCGPPTQANPRIFSSTDGNGNRRAVVFVPGRSAQLTSRSDATVAAVSTMADSQAPAGRFFVVTATGQADAVLSASAEGAPSTEVVIPRDETQP